MHPLVLVLLLLYRRSLEGSSTPPTTTSATQVSVDDQQQQLVPLDQGPLHLVVSELEEDLLEQPQLMVLEDTLKLLEVSLAHPLKPSVFFRH